MSFQHTSFLPFQSPSYHTPFTYFPILSHFLPPFLYNSSSSLPYTTLRLPAFIVSHFLYLFPSYASYSLATLSILSPIPSSFSSSFPAWDYFLLLLVFLSYLFLSLFVLFLSRFWYCCSRLDSTAFLKVNRIMWLTRHLLIMERDDAYCLRCIFVEKNHREWKHELEAN